MVESTELPVGALPSTRRGYLISSWDIQALSTGFALAGVGNKDTIEPEIFGS